MPRVLRSDSLRRRTLPWEMLAHIYSYCDASTLAVLSLVSFGSWEVASPILYEHVEIVDPDGLASLFFLESPAPTVRLRNTVCPLSRIRSLSVEIKDWHQTTGPLLDTSPGPSHGHFGVDFVDWTDIDPIAVVRPHRLYRHTSETPLPIRELILLVDGGWGTVRRQDFLPAQLYPLLRPRTVVNFGLKPDWTSSLSSPSSVAFLDNAWDNLERIVYDGVIPYHHAEDYFELPLAVLWAKQRAGQGRKLELVFDLSSRASYRYKTHLPNAGPQVRHRQYVPSLQSVVVDGGLTKEMLKLVDLKVTVRVRTVDEAIARKDVDALEGWMKELVVVEAV